MTTTHRHHMSYRRGTAVIVLLMLFAAGAFPLRAQNVIRHGVFGSGGASSANATYTLHSTAGQTFTGTTQNVAVTHSAGFWYVTGARVVPTSIRDDDGTEHLPGEFRLHQNYPNPFNPATNIQFDLPKQSSVVIDVFNITGQHVMRLVNETLPTGRHTVTFDAGRLTSGVYLYRLQADGYGATGTMMLIK
jgi:hypothetical protein